MDEYDLRDKTLTEMLVTSPHLHLSEIKFVIHGDLLCQTHRTTIKRNTCHSIKRNDNYVISCLAGSGSSCPFHTDVKHSRPFVPSVLNHWRVKMALSNLNSQQMKKNKTKHVQLYCTYSLKFIMCTCIKYPYPPPFTHREGICPMTPPPPPPPPLPTPMPSTPLEIPALYIALLGR